MSGWILFSATIAVLSSWQTPAFIQLQPAGPPRQPAAAVQIHGDGTVTIRASGVPLQTLLDALSPVCHTELRIDAALRTRSIMVETIRSTPTGAVLEILKASGL
ncbi:MAG: hypothetical protein ABIS06_16600, partial [Vicinamibacterales bacterium]